MELTYEAMELSADTGLTMFASTAEPGSKSEEALDRLGSGAASVEREANETTSEVSDIS
jgi:hypothetical protein